MKAADLFVRQLEEEGVEYIFGLPGEENLHLIEALRKSHIKFILTRHEQGAAFMAATYGRLTGHAGVCLSTLGPGATNLVTGIAHAQLIGAPLISISGQKALKHNTQARFQLIDIVSLMKPITKKSISIADPDMVPTVLRDAFKAAEAERPGAVHIELPEDVAGDDATARIQQRFNVRRPSPDEAAITAAAGLIEKSRYPLIILSAGANRKRINAAMTEFTGKTGIYAVHTQMGKGVLSDRSDRSLYAAGIHRHDYVNCGIDKADLIITIGYNIVEYPPYVWNKGLEKKIVNIDFVESQPDVYYNPDVEVIGDISRSLRLLSQKLGRRDFPAFRDVRSAIEKKIDERQLERFPPLPQSIVQDVREFLSEEDIVVLDNGIYKLWFSRFYRTYRPNTFLLDNALATMGAGLPAAITAKILNPQKKVVAVVGDGGFMMNSQELETALRLNVSMIVLILKDDGYGFIKWKQKEMGYADYAMDFSNPDFVRYAESYGAKGFRVGENLKLSQALKKAHEAKTLAVIECPIDYSQNYAVFSQELKNLVC